MAHLRTVIDLGRIWGRFGRIWAGFLDVCLLIFRRFIENRDLSKIIVFPKENRYFARFELVKIGMKTIKFNKSRCKITIRKEKPKNCSKKYIWEGLGLHLGRGLASISLGLGTWAVLWALWAFLGLFFGRSKSLPLQAWAQDGIQEASGIDLGSILDGFGEVWGGSWDNLGSILKGRKERLISHMRWSIEGASAPVSSLTCILIDYWSKFIKLASSEFQNSWSNAAKLQWTSPSYDHQKCEKVRNVGPK